MIDLRSVNKVPTVGATALEVAGVRNGGGKAGKGCEGDAHVGAGVASAVGTDVCIVCCCGVEIVENYCRVVGNLGESGGTAAGDKIGCVVFNHPSCGGAHLGPTDVGIVHAEAVDMQIGHMGLGNRNVVDIYIIGGRTTGLYQDGDITRAGG